MLDFDAAADDCLKRDGTLEYCHGSPYTRTPHGLVNCGSLEL